MHIITPPLHLSIRRRGGLLALLGLAAFSVSAFAQGTPSPRLIPFQGRLTNQTGIAYDNGQYTITFNLYSLAIGGSTVWTERHEKVSVIGGMVNLFLGSVNAIDTVDFATTKYLGITVDADNNPATADPEMVPRTMIVPAFHAKSADNSAKLANHDWSRFFLNVGGQPSNDPSSGFLSGAKVFPGSIATVQIANNSIIADKIQPDSIITSKIADNAVTTPKIADNSVVTSKLPDNAVIAAKIAQNAVTTAKIPDDAVTFSKRSIRSNGGVSATAGNFAIAASSGDIGGFEISDTQVANQSVTLECRGGVVMISATSQQGVESKIGVGNSTTNNARAIFTVYRNGSPIGTQSVQTGNGPGYTGVPPGAISIIDIPPAGQHTYSLRVRAASSGSNTQWYVQHIRLFAVEL